MARRDSRQGSDSHGVAPSGDAPAREAAAREAAAAGAEPDLSFLDHPGVLAELFPLGYIGFNLFGDLESGAIHGRSGFFEPEAGVRLRWGLWTRSEDSPSILYFHGNGETVADYDWFAPTYVKRGMNLCVVDYRGYGRSTGEPTFANTLSDARMVFGAFRDMLAAEGFRDSVFVMGRSIGSIPACEVAAHCGDDLRGLILESGAANNFRYRWSDHRPERDEVLGEDGVFLNKVKLRGFTKPTLIIHGRNDGIVPFSEAEENYRNVGAVHKQLLALDGGHNDIMSVDAEAYFGAIEEFVRAYDSPEG